MNKSQYQAVVYGICTSMIGCAGVAPEEPEEGDFEDLSTASEAVGPVGHNGLAPHDFWDRAHQRALRRLGGAALLDAGGTLSAGALLATAGGRRVLKYVVQCAMPRDMALSSVDGETFRGAFGLAPAWARRGLYTSEQRWMTACLLDHLNGFGMHVPIMLEGRHPALVPTPGKDVSGFTVDDITTFGNVFAATPRAYVCVNTPVELSCDLDLSEYTLSRICGFAPSCGMTLLGPCALSCTRDAAGASTCQVPLGSRYPEAISSKLERTSSLSPCSSSVLAILSSVIGR